MKLLRHPFFNDLVALCSGAMLTLAFAPYSVFPLAIVAMLGLLYTWLNTSTKRAFVRGFLFGIGLFSTGVYWVYISIYTFGGAPLPLAIVITVAFIAILALFPAMTGYFLSRYFPATNKSKILFAFPALFVFFEWIRSWLFTGFPWLLLGYSQTNSPLRGYAPIFSVYGVSLTILLTSSLLLLAIMHFRRQENKAGYMCLLRIAGFWIGGSALCLITWTTPVGKPQPVSLVQGNIPQTLKWSPEHVQLSLDTYANMTKPYFKKNNIIIWPEAAIPMSLQDAKEYVNELDTLAQKHQSALMLGIPVYSPESNGYVNALITLGKDQNVYIKHRLVPFGEYIPFPKIFGPIFSMINIPMSNMVSTGGPAHPMTVNGIKILTFICYEIAFPEQVLNTDSGVGLLLTVTNDGWFGRSIAQAQHLQMAQMRSIEMARPGIFVSNDGITAIIAANGIITAAAPPYQAYVLSGVVQPMVGKTPWQRFGMDPILLVLICLLVLGFITRRKTALE